METTYNPADEQEQSDPYIQSLAAMDSETVKQTTDSLFKAAPASALVTRSKAERRNAGVLRKMYDWANKHSSGYLDPVVRGAARGYNEVGRSIAGGIASLNEFGADHLGMSVGANQEEYRAIQRDGMVTARAVEAALGDDKNEGMHAFVRDASQFMAARAIVPALGKGVIAQAVRNAGADAFGFDPKQERLSNLLQNAPAGIGEPFKALATNPDDSEALARAKAAMEGLFLGSTIDHFIHGIKSVAGKGMAKWAARGQVESGAARAPKLGDFAKPVAAGEATHEPFMIEPTDAGEHRVVPRDAAQAAQLAEHPTFKTAQEAEVVAATFNFKAKNAARPALNVTPEQAAYFKQVGEWIHATGKYEDFQHGTLDVDTGELVGGVGDVNFRYDLAPEQVGHMIGAISAAFREAVDGARVPQSLMRDASRETRGIGHAETVAKAAQDYGGMAQNKATNRLAAVSDALDEVPSAIVAAKVLRQNVARQAEQLGRAMDAAPNNPVAHQEYLKAVNTLVQSFVAEKRLLSGAGRALNAGQIKVGVAGAQVSAEELGRSLKKGKVNPLDVLHFELIDEPLEDAAIAELDAVHPGAKGDHTPESMKEAAAAGPAPKAEGSVSAVVPDANGKPVKKSAKLTPQEHAAGPNTFTLVDEAQHKIDKALDALDKAEGEATAKRATEKQQLAAVQKDERAMTSAARDLGITAEDVKLAKDRMRAAHYIVATKRDAGQSVGHALEGLTNDEIGDLASINAERIRRLADAQRETPLELPPAKEKVKADPKDKPNAGVNTFGLVDEATHRIKEAEKKIDEAVFAKSQLSEADAAARQDKLASAQLPKHDPARINAAVELAGGSAEDFKLARERLLAIKQTIAEKRASAGINVVDWTRYSNEALDDLASMHGERVMKLAEEQRRNPMTPRSERTVYVTARQARAMARQLTYFPKNAAERDHVLNAILGMGRKVTENAADAPPSWWGKVASYRAWSMLSKPTTAVVNFMSATSVALYRPMEGLLGSAVRGDVAGITRQKNLLVGTLQSFQEAMRVASASLQAGESKLLARDASVPQVGPVDASADPIKRLFSWARVGERLMTAGDEFAQQIAYRGHVYAQSMEHARAAGVTGEELAQRVGDDIEAAFNEAGRGMNPSALAYAQDVTLRRQLDGGIGGWIEQGARTNPVLRILFPFTRIPANLVRYQIDRTPVLGMLTRNNRADFAAGGALRDEAIGRQVAGVMTWSMGLAMANAGQITGAGPKDPELRRQWLNVYQPYSIKVGDQWISYRRFEPISTPLGIMADFHQMMGDMDDAGADEVIPAFLAGVAQNLTSKTYLKGLSDIMYAASSGKTAAMDAAIDGLLGSFIPNALQGANPDDALRQTRSVVDRLTARIPGLSSTLEPRRNIYGEKVMKPGNQFQRMFNPFTVREDKADDVDIELLRIGAGMSMPAPKKYGVDLTDRTLGKDGQSPYDRWMELMSLVQPDGQPSLREYLREYVKGDEYAQLTDSENGYKGSRLLAVEKIVRSYRAAAFARLVEESQDSNGTSPLLDAIRKSAGERGSVLSGDPDVAAALVGNSTSEQLKGHAAEAAAFLGSP